MNSLKDTDVFPLLVIAGGHSSERGVSVRSGNAVASALRTLDPRVDLLDPSRNQFHPDLLVQYGCIVPMVHGTGGEDGRLQTQLEAAGVPYVGSSPEASELTFDKQATRLRLAAAGIAVPFGFLWEPDRNDSHFHSTAGPLLRLPAVVKPCRQGSSVGVSIVRTAEQMESALVRAQKWDDRVLVEDYIPGREITVAVIERRALPPIEIMTPGGWYDYEAKYVSAGTRYRVLNPHDWSATMHTAVTACAECGVGGIARVDFRVDSAGQAWLLEINTVPGMTESSLVPRAAAAAGYSLAELLIKACRKAVQHRQGATNRRAA